MADISVMPPSKDKKRFEVHLLPDAVKAFEKLSKDDKRSIKNYMEKILLDHLEEVKKKKKYELTAGEMTVSKADAVIVKKRLEEIRNKK